MKILKLLPLICSGCFLLSAQIPAGSLSLIGPSGVRPGKTITLELTLATSAAPAGLQWSLSSPLTLPKPEVGSAAAAAGKDAYCSDAGTCLIIGLNTNTIQPGPVAVYSVAIPSGRAPGSIMMLELAGVQAANKDGVEIAILAGPPLILSVLPSHDLNEDGVTNMADVTLMLDQVLRRSPCVDDQNGDGKCDLIDVLRVIRGALP